jgi:DNA-binding MarR family transcriptional regulator
VRITPAGLHLHETVRAERTAALAARLEHLSAEQVRSLLDALPALEALADALGKSTTP